MNRKINKRRVHRIEYKYIILIILFILTIVLGVLASATKDDRKLNPIESFFKDGFSLIQKTVNKPFRYISSKIEQSQNKKNLLKKYEKILSDKRKYDLIKTENIELKRQIEALKEQLNISTILTEYEKVNATIISRNVGYWFNTITIDKGKSAGIKPDMIVINSEGLIGKIIKVSNLTSTVKLITNSDINNKISITIKTKTDLVHGLLSSYDYKGNLLLVEGISNTVKIEKDSVVSTSGFGGIYPSGILIGHVESTTSDAYDLTKFIKVKPTVDFYNLDYVSVLKRVGVQ